MSNIEATPVFNKNDDDTKARIVEQAVKLFCKKGYNGTSVREIVAAAKVTKPMLYYYFKNKEALFNYILEFSFLSYIEDYQKICGNPELDFVVKLKGIVDLHIEVAQKAPEYIRFIHAIAYSGLYDELFDFTAYWRKIIDCTVCLFDEAKKENLVRDDIDSMTLARCFLALAEKAMETITFCPKEWGLEPNSDEIVDLILKGVIK